MKCSLCGADLIDGNNTCPKCGSLNMAFNQAAAPVQTNTPVQTDQQPVEMPVVQTVPNINAQEEIETITPTDDGVEVLDMPVKAEETKEGEVIDASTSGFVDLDEGEAEVVQASEDMQAPTLDVNQENMDANAKDISSSSEVSTYDPTQAVPEDVSEENMPRESGLNFALPEISEAKEDTQGMAIPEIETKGETVGVESEPVKTKFSLKIFKKKTLPRNVVLILLGVVLVIGILLGSLLFGKKVYTPGTTKKTNTSSIPHVADGKNNVTYIGNFVYKIPQSYDFDKNDHGIVVFGTNDDFRMTIKAMKGSYETVANAKESIKLSIDNVGISVDKVQETNVGGANYVIINATTSMKNRMYAIRTGVEGYVFYVELVTADNNYNADLLTIANDIIDNVELNEKYSEMEKISYEDIAQLIVTTASADSAAKNNA